MPQRIADEKRIERQWMILNKITRRNGVTKQQLIAETGVSERTIERDIPILMRYFPSIIEEREGRQKRYKFKDDYHFPALDLSLPERLALTLAQDITTFLEGTPYFEALTDAIRKIHATLPTESQDYFNRIQNVLAFRLQPVKDFQSVAPHINQAQTACEKRQRLDLLYHSASRGESLQRKVDPYGIAYSDNALRLIGYCHTRKALREFVFDDRMRSLTILDETFEGQAGFDLNEYIARGFGGIKITNRCRQSSASIRPLPLGALSEMARSAETDRFRETTRIELHFDTEGREGLCVRFCNGAVAPKSSHPPIFVQEIAQEIEKMTKKYENP